MEITPKRYWRRWRGYEKLDESSMETKTWSFNRRKGGNRVKMDPTRKRRFWRIKIMPKLRILKTTSSAKKLLVWIRDSYVKMMMRLANSRVIGSTYGGSGFGSGPLKEYDEKILVEIYKSILLAQGNIVHRDTLDKLDSSSSDPAMISVSNVR